MRQLAAIVFAYFLVACQTVGIEGDPDATKKQVIAATALAVDAIGAYGKLPNCATGVGDLCKKQDAYNNAKLVAKSFNATVQTLSTTNRSDFFLTAGLLYFQYAAAKGMANAPGPTDPEAPPTPAAVAQLEALGAADVLISSAAQRVKDASGPNVTVSELLADLQARISSLP